MLNRPDIIRTVTELRAMVSTWRRDGQSIALVPTMGALHDGHLSLMRLAATQADRVVASIFVNPAQFGPGEDFERYPRTEAEDVAKLATVGVDAAFVPHVREMYPEGFATRVHIERLGDVLCGAHRPGHFDGMALIVVKLLTSALPDVAIFGEKDYQQLQIIRRFTADLNIPVRIMGAPIEREADGLALSSRNRYLSPEQRQTAVALSVALRMVRDAVRSGDDPAAASAKAREDILQAGFDAVDYVEVRDPWSLELVTEPGRPARVFGAARLGSTRLIDNWAIE
ncbi:pantoate--beta-alanine ligase [Iodidimonas sp. SYSU 1G8]|uniref:pantoate--beta-alanine ligase n=1 Tax=Iodidimonas sp. SYSU 1G8 TaxID=3133967 RepID=UPI0031FE4494